MLYVKTVGQLKEFIKNLDDNMPLISVSNNFELKGNIVDQTDVYVDRFKRVESQFVDGFDHTVYKEHIYKRDKDGVECLKIG